MPIHFRFKVLKMDGTVGPVFKWLSTLRAVVSILARIGCVCMLHVRMLVNYTHDAVKILLWDIVLLFVHGETVKQNNIWLVA